MSKAGCPYDNAPMERYFNTLKNECTNLYEFATEEALYQRVEEFAYVDYNQDVYKRQTELLSEMMSKDRTTAINCI